MQNNLKIKSQRAAKRALKVRSRILRTNAALRLSVFRSNKYVWAQIIDDAKSVTLVSASSKGISEGKKTQKALEVGKKIAEGALAKKIKKVVFDRGAYQYHGQVEAVAKGAREGGLEF